MSVASEAGRGSKFSFTVLLGDADVPCVRREGVLSRALLNTKVLVIAENRTNRSILERLLSSWGMIVDSAASRDQAFSALETADSLGEPYCLLVVDMLMPRAGGPALIEQLRENKQLNPPAIGMTTSARLLADVTRCRDLNVAACLLKPLRESELYDAAMRIVSGWKAPSAANVSVGAEQGLINTVGSALNILVADDNLVNQKVASRLLEKRGHKVTLASNGRDVLILLETQTFDLILMDVQMPIMSGVDATTEIRRRELKTGHHVPICAVTANAMKGDRERYISAGMDGYLSKPIGVDKLDLLLREHAARKGLPTA